MSAGVGAHLLTTMARNTDLAVGNLASNPAFDFVKLLLNSDSTFGNEDDTFEDSPYSYKDISSSYMDETEHCTLFSNINNFSIFSVNIQSLPSKFNEFNELITSMLVHNCAPDIICWQELCKFPDHTAFNLPGYHPLEFKLWRNATQGGGVGIYVKSSIKYSLLPHKTIFVYRVFESLFIEVESTNRSQCIVGSVYRPGTKHPLLSPSDQFNNFMELLSNLCSDLSDYKSPVYIFGDFNLAIQQLGTGLRVHRSFFLWAHSNGY